MSEYISKPLRKGVTVQARHRCGYCLTSEAIVGTPMEIDHMFNPRRQIWQKHFAWTAEGDRIIGLTAIGRATVIALNLNRPSLVKARQVWVAAGWHPPKD